MSAELELERREPRTWWRVAEDLVSVAALMLMVLLPVIEGVILSVDPVGGRMVVRQPEYY